jgi:hypothetical protein
VPTRNRRSQVLHLIESLQDDPAVLEIIVVVDGGTDLTMTALNVLVEDIPRLRPIWQEHAGAGAARQNGVQCAHGDFVLLLDDDVRPRARLASGHLAAHIAMPGRLVVGSMPLTLSKRRTVHSVVDDLYAQDYETCCADYRSDPSTVLSHLWSGNLSLNRRTALLVGVGDPEFDMLFFEDRDFGLRLRAAGIEGVFEPQLCAVHHHVGTLRGYLRDSVRQGKALVLLRLRYPTDVPAPTPRQLSGRFPFPVRIALASAQRSPNGAGVVLTESIFLLSYASGLLRLWKLQRLLVILLRRVGQAKGVGAGRLARRAHRPVRRA